MKYLLKNENNEKNLGKDKIEGLNSGETITSTLNFKIQMKLKFPDFLFSPFKIVVIIDYKNQVDEINENNNILSCNYDISYDL